MVRRKKRAGSAGAALSLMWNTPMVMGLRLAKIARGGKRGKAESHLMITEKMAAAAEAQAIMARAILGGAAPQGAERVARLYARKVAANRRRLSR